VGLVIATLGFAQGHLTHPVFIAIVFSTIAVSILGPLLMAPFARSLGAEYAAGPHPSPIRGLAPLPSARHRGKP
jgi:Kef-type K+ transport system membrane component KefB